MHKPSAPDAPTPIGAPAPLQTKLSQTSNTFHADICRYTNCMTDGTTPRSTPTIGRARASATFRASMTPPITHVLHIPEDSPGDWSLVRSPQSSNKDEEVIRQKLHPLPVLIRLHARCLPTRISSVLQAIRLFVLNCYFKKFIRFIYHFPRSFIPLHPFIL